MENKKFEIMEEKNITDAVLNKVHNYENTGSLLLPDNYSAENALKSAYLTLQDVKTRDQKPALTACTKESVANALLDMVVQGLNPMKKQCYFICYGDKLTLMRSYFGTMAVAKSFNEIEDITAQVILEGDTFEYDIVKGFKVITKHTQTFASLQKKKIVGAYATIIFKDGREVSEIMTMEDIKKSWKQSKTYSETKADCIHNQFTDEMAKRTVINKLCKPYINSKKDTNLLLKQAIDGSDEDRTISEFEEEVSENANKEDIDIVDVTYTAVSDDTDTDTKANTTPIDIDFE